MQKISPALLRGRGYGIAGLRRDADETAVRPLAAVLGIAGAVVSSVMLAVFACGLFAALQAPEAAAISEILREVSSL